MILILVASFIIIGMIVIIGVVSCVLLCFEEDIASDIEDQVVFVDGCSNNIYCPNCFIQSGDALSNEESLIIWNS